MILSFISMFAGYVCAQTTQYCLENDIIHSYLNDFSYEGVSWDSSYVMEYFNRGKDDGYRMDAPKPIPLSWTKTAGAESQRIEVSESADFADALVYAVSADAESYDVYNLIPGKKYYYRVVSTAGGTDSVLGSGDFETSGALRMILADGTWNVRDAGGWISSLTGKPIAYGKIYRGAQLKAANKDSIILSAQGIESMRQIGIRAELDLRSSSQVPSNVSALAKKDADGNYDVDFVVIPEAVNARMYHFANNDATIRELQWIINRLKQNKPVYYHCQNGADRTGTLGFLIGALLGMNESDLAKDYELTTFCEPIAAAYDPTEVGFARLRNYEGKKGSPIGSSEDNKEYMFAELANTMKSVAPINGSYHDKIYNFFRTGVNGTSISAADLSWFIMEMTGYPILGGLTTDVDTLQMEIGGTQKINVSIFPEGAEYSSISFKSTSTVIATVSEDGLVTAVGGGEAYIIVDVDGIEKYIPVIVPISEESVVCISVSNEYVERYLDEVDYHDDVNYSVSYIERYDTISSSSRKDWPQPARLKWTSLGGVTNQHLFVSETSDFSSCFIDTQLGDKDSTYKFDDLCPGKIYYYKITATVSGKSNVMLMSSAFKVSGVVRMIKLRSAYNVRDLGGWTGLGGHKVKYNVLFRGCRLRDYKVNNSTLIINSEEQIYLTNLGITAELDLRNDDESNSSKSALYRRGGTFKRISNASECQGENILSGDAYISALNYLIDCIKNGKVVYISGVFGAERTGTMAFLINGLLGVDEDGLSKDYELSSFSGDKLAKVVCKRNSGDYPAMVSKIKTLEGETLQQKIYNYFKDGVNGTSISSEDLDWFICYMLGIDAEELGDIKNDVKPIVRTVSGNARLFNASGQEIPAPVPGINIVGDKIIYLTK